MPRGRVGAISLCGSIFVTSFVTYFLYSGMFGSHSDDQYWAALYLSGHLVEGLLRDVQALGRPLGLLSMLLLYPLFKIGGLSLAYIGVCVFLSIEVLLVFFFIQMFLPRTPSFGLALIYLLFPADLSKYMFLSFISRTSAIMFWIAAILYVKRKPILSGFVAAATMLAYESHLAQAMFIPLIVFILSQFSNPRLRPSREELSSCVRFVLALGITGGLLLVARVLFAPGRLPSALGGEILQTAERLVSAGWLGIGAVILSHVDRFRTFISNPSWTICTVLGILVLLNVLLWRLWNKPAIAHGPKEVGLPAKLVQSSSLVAVGLALMYVSYFPFALEPMRWPPTAILTRLSSVHLGASIGYVLIWAGFFQLASIGSSRLGSVLSGAAFALYTFVMGGFFLLYQQRIVHNWELQTVYWRQLEECVREVQPRLIVVDDADEEATAVRTELIFDWTTPYVPYLIEEHRYRPPEQWPLVQPISMLQGAVRVTPQDIHLTDLKTWFVFPTTMQIAISDIMLVKPLGGALVRPPEFIRIGPTTIQPWQICYTTANPR
jgi:hypothetical protein